MKSKWLFLLILVVLFTGCHKETEQEIKSEISQLKSERTLLIQEKIQNQKELQSLNNTILSTQKKLDFYTKYEREPRYILELELRQSHFTLDLSVHYKDELNKITFKIPVDEQFYNSVNINTEIVDKFRSGSFIMYGSLGEWKMKVIGKEIQ